MNDLVRRCFSSIVPIVQNPGRRKALASVLVYIELSLTSTEEWLIAIKIFIQEIVVKNMGL